MKKTHLMLLVALALSLVFGLSGTAKAQDNPDPPPTPDRVLDESLPGEPPFPVTNRELPYWIHNCSVTADTVTDVDARLQALDESRKTQTVILCMPYGEVHDGVLYAITFYNHMQLGYTDYAYRDRGFVWLVQVDATHMKINYAVGEGLPLLDAVEIDAMRDEAIASYLASSNLDASLTTLSQQFVDRVSAQYPEVTMVPTAPPQAAAAPPVTQDNGIGIFGILCIVGVVLLLGIVVVIVIANNSGGSTTYHRDSTYSPPYFPPGRSSGSSGSYSSPRSTYSPPRSSYNPPSSSSRPSSPPRTGGGGGGARRGG